MFCARTGRNTASASARLTRGGAAYDPAMRQYMPRPDGLSNTITTVQKDNLLIEMEEDEILSAH